MKRLVLAEKPSQGRDIAAGLDDRFARRDGYLEGSRHVVTWAVGHLVAIVAPDKMNPDWGKWDLDALPILPESFRYGVTPGGRKQFAVIKGLLAREDVSEVVICTDPGREGELIARLILRQAGCRKPLKRFWTSKALTPETVREGFANLRPAAEFDRLYEAALARQQGDWIIGINATRAWTKAVGGYKDVYSLGRVQTPTLAILASRELEIRGFTPREFWTVEARFAAAAGEYAGRWVPAGPVRDEDACAPADDGDEPRNDAPGRLWSEAEALAVVNRVQGSPGRVESVETAEKSEAPPQLFSLTTLQQEANRRFGFPAARTLALAQALYEEHKLVTYPRTESRHLNEEMAPECLRILQALRGVAPYDPARCTVSARDRRVFDSSKLTDHHALIPTGRRPGALDEGERKLFELVVRRFAAAFYPPHRYRATTAVTLVGEDRFVSRGRTVTEPGWRAVYGGAAEDALLPALSRGEAVRALEAAAQAGRTQPPPRYTDASILKAMTNAQRFVREEKLRKVLRETAGLGTPATRAAILDTLVERGYVEREQKSLVPTEKALFVIGKLRDEKIADPAYTALWEQELEDIAAGRARGSARFMEAVARDAAELVGKAKASASAGGARPAGGGKPFAECPNCGAPVRDAGKGWVCTGDREACGLAVWKTSLTHFGVKAITERQAKALLAGREVEFKKLKGRSGKVFSVPGRLDRVEFGGKAGWGVRLLFGAKGN